MKSITVVTPPTSYPVTLEDAKLYAKIDDDNENALIISLIAAATNSAEEYLNRALITQTLKLTLDLQCNGYANQLGDGIYDLPISAIYGDLPRVIALPKAPVQSVTHIKTYDESSTLSTYSSANYYLDTAGARVVLYSTAVWTSSLREKAACEVTYVAGYGAASSVPMAIKTAILMHVQYMYDNRLVCEMPQPCMNLLNQYRIYGL